MALDRCRKRNPPTKRKQYNRGLYPRKEKLQPPANASANTLPPNKSIQLSTQHRQLPAKSAPVRTYSRQRATHQAVQSPEDSTEQDTTMITLELDPGLWDGVVWTKEQMDAVATESQEDVSVLMQDKNAVIPHEVVQPSGIADRSQPEGSAIQGNRLVALDHFMTQYETMVCSHRDRCKEKLSVLNEKRKGFFSYLTVMCTTCHFIHRLSTFPKWENASTNINAAAVMGFMSIACGSLEMRRVMAAMDVPPLSAKGFKEKVLQLQGIRVEKA